jgi:hypothetical protein
VIIFLEDGYLSLLEIFSVDDPLPLVFPPPRQFDPAEPEPA